MQNLSPLQDMNDFVNTVSDFIELDFVPDGRHSRHDGSGTFEWLAVGECFDTRLQTPELLSVYICILLYIMLKLIESASRISKAQETLST